MTPTPAPIATVNPNHQPRPVEPVTLTRPQRRAALDRIFPIDPLRVVFVLMKQPGQAARITSTERSIRNYDPAKPFPRNGWDRMIVKTVNALNVANPSEIGFSAPINDAPGAFPRLYVTFRGVAVLIDYGVDVWYAPGERRNLNDYPPRPERWQQRYAARSRTRLGRVVNWIVDRFRGRFSQN